MGLKSFGENVQISRFARFYGAHKISIGNNVRIDDFCVLSGYIEIGNFVHLATTSYFTGGVQGSILLKDFCNISSHCAIFAISDDYLGNALTNPTVPAEFTNVTVSVVTLEKHVIVGSHSTILPGVVIGEGASVGAHSLVKKSLAPWGVYAGNPLRKIKERKRDLLEKERLLMQRLQKN